MNEKMNQEKAVLRHLRTNNYITSMIAFDLYGITRLSSIIHRLRKQGYNIETKMVYTTNRFGYTVGYANYYLKEN